MAIDEFTTNGSSDVRSDEKLKRREAAINSEG